MRWLPRTFLTPDSGSLMTARRALAWRSLPPGVRVSTRFHSAALADAFRPAPTVRTPRSSMTTGIGSSTRTPSKCESATDPSRRLATFDARDVKCPEHCRHIHSPGSTAHARRHVLQLRVGKPPGDRLHLCALRLRPLVQGFVLPNKDSTCCSW